MCSWYLVSEMAPEEVVVVLSIIDVDEAFHGVVELFRKLEIRAAPERLVSCDVQLVLRDSDDGPRRTLSNPLLNRLQNVLFDGVENVEAFGIAFYHASKKVNLYGFSLSSFLFFLNAIFQRLQASVECCN